MFGYIYKTTNKLNGMIYIGKHKCKEFDNTYYGSGKIILDAIEKNGIENFEHEMLYQAGNKDELDAAEKRYISEFRSNYGSKMYNQAEGGDGGNVFKYADDEIKQKFVDKMTEINRMRCRSDEFRQMASDHAKELWNNSEMRKRFSKSRKEMWQNAEYRNNHIEKLKDYYKRNPKDNSYLNKRTLLVVNGERLLFASQQYAIRYLIDKFNFHLCRKSLRRLERLSKVGAEYEIFHYNKFPGLKTLQIFYVNADDKGVETRADECKPVSLGIGAKLKCTTDQNGNIWLEEIVQSR